MSEWSEKVTDILENHIQRSKSIKQILIKLLNELSVFKNDLQLINQNDLEWKISLSLKTFLLTDEEILSRQEITEISENGFEVITGEKRDLEEVIRELILEKIG